jgi:hypothetical protein
MGIWGHFFGNRGPSREQREWHETLANAPEQPTFGERITNSGEYMKQVRKIIQTNLHDYQQNKRRLEKELEHQEKKLRHKLEQQKDKVFGPRMYNVASSEKWLEQAKASGDPRLVRQVERQADRIKDLAEDRYGHAERQVLRHFDRVRRDQLHQLKSQMHRQRSAQISTLREASKSRSLYADRAA